MKGYAAKNSHYLNLDRDEKIFFSMPSGWTLANPVKNENKELYASIGDLTGKALQKSANLQFFNEELNKKLIAIIVDDLTRPTPVKDILPVLINHLKQYNVSENNISIVIATGSHAQMSGKELTAKLGTDIAARYKVIQHDAMQSDLVKVKVHETGMTVKVNPVVMDSDIKIGISSILPHPFAGYGGGPKILMPGVCDRESLITHHMLNAIHPKAKAGITAGNPFHKSCMTIAKAIGLDLSINCVYNKFGYVADIIAGNLENAYQEAVALCIQKLGITLEKKVDITISSSYPHVHGIQFCKGLASPVAITKSTGAAILAAPIKSSLPDDFVNAVVLIRDKYGKDTPVVLANIMSHGKLIFDDKSPEFNMALFDLLGRLKIRTILFSPMIPPDTASKLGFESVQSIEEGISILEKSYPRARVAVLQAGGFVIPAGNII